MGQSGVEWRKWGSLSLDVGGCERMRQSGAGGWSNPVLDRGRCVSLTLDVGGEGSLALDAGKMRQPCAGWGKMRQPGA